MTPATRWALTGALLGALAAAVVFAPARWVAWALLQASQGRVVLGHAQGTVWSGHAQVTLTGGPGSRDALTLPGQLSWKLDGSGGWGGLAARWWKTRSIPACAPFCNRSVARCCR